MERDDGTLSSEKARGIQCSIVLATSEAPILLTISRLFGSFLRLKEDQLMSVDIVIKNGQVAKLYRVTGLSPSQYKTNPYPRQSARNWPLFEDVFVSINAKEIEIMNVVKIG